MDTVREALALGRDAAEEVLNDMIAKYTRPDGAVADYRGRIAYARASLATIDAALASQEAQSTGGLQLSIIRKWPEGFEARLQHVWLDVVSFIPNVKLYDLQRVLAEFGFRMEVYEGAAQLPHDMSREAGALTFDAFRRANVARCVKWHPAGIDSWSPSDWMTAVVGELGELGSLLKMRNRERDGLPGNKFSPTQKQVADEVADVLTYLDLLAEVLGVDLGRAAAEKFNEVSERVGFPDRIALAPPQPADKP